MTDVSSPGSGGFNFTPGEGPPLGKVELNDIPSDAELAESIVLNFKTMFELDFVTRDIRNDWITQIEAMIAGAEEPKKLDLVAWIHDLEGKNGRISLMSQIHGRQEETAARIGMDLKEAVQLRKEIMLLILGETYKFYEHKKAEFTGIDVDVNAFRNPILEEPEDTSEDEPVESEKRRKRKAFLREKREYGRAVKRESIEKHVSEIEDFIQKFTDELSKDPNKDYSAILRKRLKERNTHVAYINMLLQKDQETGQYKFIDHAAPKSHQEATVHRLEGLRLMLTMIERVDPFQAGLYKRRLNQSPSILGKPLRFAALLVTSIWALMGTIPLAKRLWQGGELKMTDGITAAWVVAALKLAGFMPRNKEETQLMNLATEESKKKMAAPFRIVAATTTPEFRGVVGKIGGPDAASLVTSEIGSMLRNPTIRKDLKNQPRKNITLQYVRNIVEHAGNESEYPELHKLLDNSNMSDKDCSVLFHTLVMNDVHDPEKEGLIRESLHLS
jgi:hypothetical protein